MSNTRSTTVYLNYVINGGSLLPVKKGVGVKCEALLRCRIKETVLLCVCVCVCVFSFSQVGRELSKIKC